MRIVFILLLLLYFNPETLYAQSDDGAAAQQNLNKLTEDGYMGPVQIFDNRYAGVHGTPYLTEEWMEGIVYFNNGKETPFPKIRYDAYQDEILAQKNQQQEMVLLKGQIKGFQLLEKDNAPLIFKKATAMDELPIAVENDQFVQILFEEMRIGLYAVHKKLFIKANFQGAYSAGNNYDEFSEVLSTYFVKMANGELTEVKLNKRSVLKAFDNYKSEIAAFIKDQNPRFEQPADLVKIVQYYHSLIQNG